MKTKLPLVAAIALSVSLISCGHKNKKEDVRVSSVSKLGATLESKSKSKVKGQIDFTQDGQNVKVKMQISGLPANSIHGFHIHEFGDCSAADATSAGGHFSAHKSTHGAPGSEKHHTGDLGNIQANSKGVVDKEDTYSFFTLAGQANSIIGRAVVVHEKADDLKSQPTGDAGGRIACGVIGLTK